VNILALDLGTQTGLCFNQGEDSIVHGNWTLATKKEVSIIHRDHADRELDPRIPRFFQRLSGLVAVAPVAIRQSPLIHHIIFEDVEFASTLRQCQLWSSYRTVVWMVAHLHNIKCSCVPVKTLKKFATGSGHAEKDDMRRALERRKTFKHRVPNLTEDEVDATFLWIWAKNYLEHKVIE